MRDINFGYHKKGDVDSDNTMNLAFKVVNNSIDFFCGYNSIDCDRPIEWGWVEDTNLNLTITM